MHACQVVDIRTKVDGVVLKGVKSRTPPTSFVLANLRVPFLGLEIMHIQHLAGLNTFSRGGA